MGNLDLPRLREEGETQRGNKCVQNHASTYERFEKGDLAELGVAREDFLEERSYWVRDRYPALQLLNHMKFCEPNMVTFLQFLMAQPNILTPICKQENQSTDSKKMVELELQPRAPYVTFSSAAQLTHPGGMGAGTGEGGRRF